MTIKVKICGLTSVDDARVAVDAGADYLGFILYPKSPRYIAPAQVLEVLQQLKLPEHVQTVGVFVNVTVDEIHQTLEATGLHLAQLHGDEPPAYLAALAGPGYKAIRPPDAAAASAAAVYTPYPAPMAPQLLMDAHHPSAYGGTGQVADWSIARAVAITTPRLLLAGGLTADNVARAVAEVAPWGVDVASGVEASPGRKNHDQVRAFIANARNVG